MNANAIVLGSPLNNLVRTESGADQPVRIGASVGDCGRSWTGAMPEACWRMEETIVVVVRWSAMLDNHRSTKGDGQVVKRMRLHNNARFSG